MGEEDAPAAQESPPPLVEWVVPDQESRRPAVSAHPGRRDARIGGLILIAFSLFVAVFLAWTLANAPPPDPENDLDSLGRVIDRVIVVVAAILVAVGAWAARGGRRVRFVVGVLGALCGALILVAGGPVSALSVVLALPLFAGAFFLLRSALRPA